MSTDPTAAQKSRDFLSLNRPAFLSRYADGAQITAVEDRLRQAITDAQPIRPAVSNLLNQQVRQSIANSIGRGQIPNATPAALAQVKYQTAYSSMEHVVGLRALGREPELQLSDAHRALLVRAATTLNAGDELSKLPLPPQRAREIAAQLASIDAPALSNPFTEGPLRQAYDEQRTPKNYSAGRDHDRGR